MKGCAIFVFGFLWVFPVFFMALGGYFTKGPGSWDDLEQQQQRSMLFNRVGICEDIGLVLPFVIKVIITF